MPTLTVRAMAEMLRLPAYEQMRILSEQKYPKQAPQVFRTPFYSPALTGIRSYFRSANDIKQVSAALDATSSITVEAKRLNNQRVLNAFAGGTFKDRALLLQKNPRHLAALGSVELRLSPDLRCLEAKKERVIFINCRGAAVGGEIAAFTIEIADWVLEQNEIDVPTKQIEYVDMFNGTVHHVKKRRASTTKALVQSAKAIEAMWPTL